MPQIPQLTPQESQLAPQPGVRVSQDAPLSSFGGGGGVEMVDRDVQHLARINAQAIMEEQDRADQLRLQDAATKLSQGQNAILLSAKQRLGENAFGAPDDANKSWKYMTSEIEKGLSNDFQKAAFRQMQAKRKVDVDGEINNHVARESQVFDLKSSQDYIEAEGASALANMSNPALIDKAINNQMASIANRGGRSGAPPASIQLEQAQTASKTRLSVLKGMLEGGNDLAGKQFYEANKDGFYGEDRTRAEAWVKEKSTLGEAQRQVDKIFSTYYDTTEAGDTSTTTAHYAPETEAEAMEEARAIKDPVVRAKVEDLTSQRWHLIQRSKVEANKRDMLQAANDIDAGKTFDQLDLALKDRLSPTDRKTLKNYAKGEVVTDQKTWYALNLMAAHPETRAEFKSLNLSKYLDKLDKGDFQEISKLQTGLMKDDAKAKKEADGFRGTAAIVNGTISKSVPEKDHEKFMRVINEKVRVWKQDNKTDSIPDKEVERMTDELLEKRRSNLFTLFGIESGHWWLSETQKYEDLGEFYGKYKMLPEEAKRQYVAQKSMFMLNDIPKIDREYIESQFKSRGLVYTGVDVLDAYSRLKADREKRAANAGK